MVEVSLKDILRALRNFPLPKFELVVGIASGGVIPAAMIAAKVGCDLKVMRIKYRNRNNRPQFVKPKVIKRANLPKNINKILIVDDVSVSGETLKTAKTLLKGYCPKTMVLKGRADYVLFPGLKTCIRWSWTA